MLQNLRLLKWARYYGIKVSWNLLWGFPGESEADYLSELDVLQMIPHLEPPSGCGRVWLERFSPYFIERDRFSISNVRPEASYECVYPSDVNLSRAAYFFDYDSPSTVPEEAHRGTEQLVKAWKERWESDRPDSLTYRQTADSVLIDDHRSGWERGTHEYVGPNGLIYEHCSDTMRTLPEVGQYLKGKGYSLSEADVKASLCEFVSRGLSVMEDGRYLSLALPRNPNV